MKRLLAYLFIVLGLGLTFNVNASAESGYCIDGLTSSFYRDVDGKKHFLKGSYWVKKIKNRKHRDCHEEEFISKAKYEAQYKKIKKLVGPFKKKKSIPLNSILTSIKGTHVLVEYNRIYESINNTKITKAEPSQTQKVARKNIKYPELLYFPDITSGMKLPNIANEGDVYKFLVTNLTNNSKWFESINSNKNIAESEALNKCKKYFKDTNTDDACLINSISILNENSNNIVKQYFVWDQQKLLFYDKTKTQIAKAEPSQTQKVAKIENLNPKKNISKSSNNKVALIIGINNYAYIPKATFANHDAKYFHHYAKNIFGIKNENIKLLIDREANLINFMRATKKWLPGKIKNGKTELIIFFAGHGLASNDRKDLYILPQDGDADLLRQTGISLSELYKHISELRPNNVTIFMDASFSGASPEATFANLIVNSKLKVPDNFTIFNSSKLNQISSSLKELKHGIFSYYLMKGLEGKADSNQDKKITNGELLAYMDLNVPQKASELGRQQDPLLTGDPDKVLISNNNKTQITKSEPTIKPKKKVKVAKVEEPKQEEF